MDEQARRIDLTTTTTDSAVESAAASGSAWAELDETFFRVVQEAFTHDFCFGASAMLASNDEPAIELPEQRTEPDRLTHEETLERLNEAIDRELALRRAMRRHPSRRRF
jgi:hypothetical protein